MPNYFVCRESPMGGISIVFRGHTYADCKSWIKSVKVACSATEYFIYKLDSL